MSHAASHIMMDRSPRSRTPIHIQDEKIHVALLVDVSPIEWDDVILYGQYVLDRAPGPLTLFLKGYFCSNLGGTLLWTS